MTNSREQIGECCICEEIASRRLPERFQRAYGTIDRICVESKDFIAFPTVSPLVVGHMLVFPKNHVSSLSKLSVPLIESLCQLATEIATEVALHGSSLYFFEHGVLEDGKGSCGISHAHLHVLPLDSSVTSVLTRKASLRFPPHFSGKLTSLLASGKNHESPYLLFGESLSDLHLTFAPAIPSQFMRHLIAANIGLPDWDWRRLTGIQRFRKTMRVFSCARFSPA
jgi:diadenosine tetraphosphate (Ap4A) HIT family hydrolase